MSNPGDADATAITDLRDLAGYLESGSKPAEKFTIGTEHEAFGYRLTDQTPPAYVPADGSAGIKALLSEIAETEPLEPILDNRNIIGLKGNGDSLSLEPGGQFELSGATLADLHATKAELEGHIDRLHRVGPKLGLGFCTARLSSGGTARGHAVHAEGPLCHHALLHAAGGQFGT